MGRACLEIEIPRFPNWKRACELWILTGWVWKRIVLAMDSRSDTARQQGFAPATPTMAMSLDQPAAIYLPTHELAVEPMIPRTAHELTGEHAAELTPNAALVQSNADLTLTVRKLWGLHSVSFTLLAHSERPRLIGGSEVSMEKKTEREKIDRSNQSGSILF